MIHPCVAAVAGLAGVKADNDGIFKIIWVRLVSMELHH